MLTSIGAGQPGTDLPFISSIALEASSVRANLTNPVPRDCPEDRSRSTFLHGEFEL